MQPVLTQVPPTAPRSTIATFMPAAERRAASAGPAWPVPMMMASYRVLMGRMLTAKRALSSRVVP